jgi:hypothetical protein
MDNDKRIIQMNDASKPAAVIWASMAAATFMVASPAFSQAPTDAQRAAIKSQCRSDYIAHCSSIPPGGMASLQCLQKNMASLSPSCQTAVRAVEAPSETKAEPAAEPKETAKETSEETSKETSKEAPKEETKAEPAPAKSAAEPAAVPKAAASSATKRPSSAQVAAIRSACRSDYQRVCAGVPTGGAPALQCLEKNKSKVSAGCQQAVAAVSGGGAAPATEATASPAIAAPAAPALVLRPMRPREVFFVMRSACGADVRALCPGVEPGGGRIIECLVSQSASLSPACQRVLGQFAAR